MADMNRIWAEAVVKYTSHTGVNLSSEFKQIDSFDDAFALVKQEQEKFETCRKRYEGIRNAAKPVLSFVQLFAQAAGEGAGVPFPAAKAIFVSVGVLFTVGHILVSDGLIIDRDRIRQACNDVSSSYDGIIDMFEGLSDFLDRCKVLLKQEMREPIRKIIVEILAHLLLIFGLATKLIKEKRLGRFFKALIGKNTDVRKAMDELDKMLVKEDRMVVTTTLSVTSDILEALEKTMKSYQDSSQTVMELCQKARNDVMAIIQQNAEGFLETLRHNFERGDKKLDEIIKAVQSVKKSVDISEIKDILSWLRAPDPSINYSDALLKRQKNTGRWFIDGHQFAKWRDSPNSSLWIYGILGCGKSVLCSTIIETIKGNLRFGFSDALAYFYFDFKDVAKQQYRSLLCSLITQLSSQCASCPAPLKVLYAGGREQPTLNALENALKLVLQCFDCTYIVVDALDECSPGSERDNLLHFINKLIHWKLESVHLLVTSRWEYDIKDTLEPLVSDRIDVNDYPVDGDIRIHLENALSYELPFTKWSKDIKEEVMKSLMSRATGMFRWVECQLETLRRCLKPARVRTALNELPPTLPDTYARILLNIREEHRDDARKILHWLAFSLRPMTLEEIAEVVAVDLESEDGPRFDPDERLFDPELVLGICSSLVTISKASIDGLDVLQLSHLSVKEFLMSNSTLTDPPIWHSVSAQSAHLIILQTCLGYLLQFNTHSARTQEYPLALYAAQSWITHLPLAGVSTPANLQKIFRALLTPGSAQYTTWAQLYDFSGTSLKPKCPRHEIPEPLYYASLAGLTQVSEWLMGSIGVDVNARGGLHGTALRAAAVEKHLDVVSTLLENGAVTQEEPGDMIVEDILPLVPEPAVRKLLKHDAKINAQQYRHVDAQGESVFVIGYMEVVHCLEGLPPFGHPDCYASSKALANALQTRFKNSGRTQDLSIAIMYYREILRLLPNTSTDYSVTLSDFGTALTLRFGQKGRLTDLDEAESLHREALELRSTSHPDHSSSLNDLASTLTTRFSETYQVTDLNEAVSLHQKAVELCPEPHPARSASLNGLASALVTRFNQVGEAADRDEAISLYREALKLRPAPHPARSASLDGLASALLARFKQMGEAANLDEAISLHHEALMLCPVPHPARSASLSGLASALVTRFNQVGEAADLDESISLYREALAMRPALHPARSASLIGLASAIFARFKQMGEATNLDEAISLYREAFMLRSAPHPDWSTSLSRLAKVLSIRFEQTGQLVDVEEALSLYRDALMLCPAPSPSLSTSLDNLASAVVTRYEQTGQAVDLEEVISLRREVLILSLAPHPDRSASLCDLANAFVARFKQTGEIADIEEADTLRREASRLDAERSALKR